MIKIVAVLICLSILIASAWYLPQYYADKDFNAVCGIIFGMGCVLAGMIKIVQSK